MTWPWRLFMKNVRVAITFDPDTFSFEGEIPLSDLEALIGEFYNQRSRSAPRVEFAWGPVSEQPPSTPK